MIARPVIKAVRFAEGQPDPAGLPVMTARILPGIPGTFSVAAAVFG